MLGQIAGEFSLLLVKTMIASFFIGSCWLFTSFLDDIANELSCMDMDMDIDEMTTADKQEMREIYCNIVQMYSDVKQLCFEVAQ